MQTDDFKNKQLSPQEQQSIEQFYISMFKYQFRNHFTKIKQYLKLHNLTIEQAIEEVNNKKSGLPKVSRELLQTTKLDILQQILT